MEIKQTVSTFESGHSTYYFDLMKDGTYSISKDEVLLEGGYGKNEGYEKFNFLERTIKD